MSKAKAQWIEKCYKSAKLVEFEFKADVHFKQIKAEKFNKEPWGMLLAVYPETCYSGLSGIIGGVGYILPAKETAETSQVVMTSYSHGAGGFTITIKGPYAASHMDYVLGAVVLSIRSALQKAKGSNISSEAVKEYCGCCSLLLGGGIVPIKDVAAIEAIQKAEEETHSKGIAPTFSHLSHFTMAGCNLMKQGSLADMIKHLKVDASDQMITAFVQLGEVVPAFDQIRMWRNTKKSKFGDPPSLCTEALEGDHVLLKNIKTPKGYEIAMSLGAFLMGCDMTEVPEFAKAKEFESEEEGHRDMEEEHLTDDAEVDVEKSSDTDPAMPVSIPAEPAARDSTISAASSMEMAPKS